MSHNQDEISFFAKTNFRNKEQVFGIKVDDRRRHMYVIGKTGMGKTNLLENLAIQDIQKGHGIAFIDPHGDTAEKLIKAIPAHRINDVIYLNPADQDFPLAFNVMEKVDPEYRHLVASGLIGVFKKIWADSWGPRLEYILRNALLALLEYPGTTLLGVTRILVDKAYRARIVEKVTDPVVRAFWIDEFSQWNDRVLQEVISPIQNKVGQFLSSSLIRNIVGQTVSSFDIRDVMDGQKILIINLAKGRIGEDNGALLGAMMITKIQLAAMGRVDMPEDERKDFYLYVDEFQNFATESFANILSEARKYHLNLILANQYVTQIDEKVRDAIFGNAGTIISFRVGATDAEFLEKEFAPVFVMNDIINLPKYEIYLKLMIDGIAGDAFSATTLPPIALEAVANEAKIIQSSRERYASSRVEVEEKIRRWSGMLTAQERQAIAEQVPKTEVPMKKSVPISRASIPSHAEHHARDVAPHVNNRIVTSHHRLASPAVAPVSSSDDVPLLAPFEPPLAPKRTSLLSLEVSESPQQSVSPATRPARQATETVEQSTPASVLSEKVLYPAQCASCGIEIQVPFIPDAKRPTFCKDCLREYQRSVAKARNEVTAQHTLSAPLVKQTQSAPVSAVPASLTTPKSYVMTEKPISLRDAQHIGPKKFKTLRHRPSVNLDEVRSLLNETKSNRE
ncbi:MAG: CxxC-x17-CxxC domain-containing protein [Minisyncoccota bacterium]